METLNSFGKVYLVNNFRFRECPEKISNKREYSLSGENKNKITKTGIDGWMGTICQLELDIDYIHFH